MKRYLSIIFLWVILFQPSPIMKGQEVNKKVSSILDVVENKKQKLFEEAFANQDTLRQLINHIKPKKVIVKKIQYVKIYKTIPIYVAEKDSIAYAKTMGKDTLEDDYLIAPLVGEPPKFSKEKRRSFLYKIFHHKNK